MKWICVLFCFTILAAQAQSWHINKNHSQINFKIQYLHYAHIQGNFKRFRGHLKMEDEKIASLDLMINSHSIDTGNNLRDGHLRREDFFSAKTYPHISFHMTSIDKDKLTGTLEIKDQIKKITLAIKKSPIIIDPWNKKSFFMEFTGKIERTDFNMNWNKVLDRGGFVLADSIEIYGTLQWQPRGGATQASKHLIPDTQALRLKDRPIHIPKVGDIKMDDVILKKAPLRKKAPKTKEITIRPSLKISQWFSYGFLWICSLGGILLLGYKVKMARNEWWADLLILILLFVFALAAFEAMPNL